MRIALAAVAFALAPAALAGTSQPVQAVSAALATRAEAPGFHEKMYQRYCAKLKEGPEAYSAFVKRMATVTGYTFTEFAPARAHRPGARPVPRGQRRRPGVARRALNRA